MKNEKKNQAYWTISNDRIKEAIAQDEFPVSLISLELRQIVPVLTLQDSYKLAEKLILNAVR